MASRWKARQERERYEEQLVGMLREMVSDELSASHQTREATLAATVRKLTAYKRQISQLERSIAEWQQRQGQAQSACMAKHLVSALHSMNREQHRYLDAERRHAESRSQTPPSAFASSSSSSSSSSAQASSSTDNAAKLSSLSDHNSPSSSDRIATDGDSRAIASFESALLALMESNPISRLANLQRYLDALSTVVMRLWLLHPSLDFVHKSLFLGSEVPRTVFALNGDRFFDVNDSFAKDPLVGGTREAALSIRLPRFYQSIDVETISPFLDVMANLLQGHVVELKGLRITFRNFGATYDCVVWASFETNPVTGKQYPTCLNAIETQRIIEKLPTQHNSTPEYPRFYFPLARSIPM